MKTNRILWVHGTGRIQTLRMVTIGLACFFVSLAVQANDIPTCTAHIETQLHKQMDSLNCAQATL